MIYIFVEGMTDSLFVNHFKDYFRDEIKIIEYSNKKSDYIPKYLKTIVQMKEKYLFLYDTDGKKNLDKKLEILKKYKNLERNSCFPVVKEIECWYFAGCSDDLLKKYKVKRITNTECYCKEKMKSDFSSNQLLSIFKEILDSFILENALLYNNSFKNWYVDNLKNNLT